MVGSKKILNCEISLTSYSIIEIPLFIFLGVLSGLLSFVFSNLKQFLFQLFSRFCSIKHRPIIGENIFYNFIIIIYNLLIN